VLINLLIFHHNPRHGGLFSCRAGIFNTLQSVLLFGVVFAMRMLFAWPFWRGIVTCGTSLVIIIYIYIFQPYFSNLSNLLSCISWVMFGSIRLSAEIGYAIEEASKSVTPQYTFLIIGFIIGISLSGVICYFITNRRKSLIPLSLKGYPLIK
jgi:hypothetical protein